MNVRLFASTKNISKFFGLCRTPSMCTGTTQNKKWCYTNGTMRDWKFPLASHEGLKGTRREALLGGDRSSDTEGSHPGQGS